MDDIFERYEIGKSINLYIIEYEYNDKFIVYSQHLIEEFYIYLLNLNIELREISVNNDKAYMCIANSVEGEIIYILWNNGIYFYSVYGILDFKELLKL